MDYQPRICISEGGHILEPLSPAALQTHCESLRIDSYFDSQKFSLYHLENRRGTVPRSLKGSAAPTRNRESEGANLFEALFEGSDLETMSVRSPSSSYSDS